MKIIETQIEGCFIFEPEILEDTRGYFYESFNESQFQKLTGTKTKFVQDNQSFSKFGVLRGLHSQSGKNAQAKLVRVLKGEVLDIAIDTRAGSITYGQHIAVYLNEINQKQLFIPKGFLHGFVVLSDTAQFFYKCDNYYDKKSEQGVRFDDDTLNINWLLPKDQLLVSEKDLALPFFNAVF